MFEPSVWIERPGQAPIPPNRYIFCLPPTQEQSEMKVYKDSRATNVSCHPGGDDCIRGRSKVYILVNLMVPGRGRMKIPNHSNWNVPRGWRHLTPPEFPTKLFFGIFWDSQQKSDCPKFPLAPPQKKWGLWKFQVIFCT